MKTIKEKLFTTFPWITKNRVLHKAVDSVVTVNFLKYLIIGITTFILQEILLFLIFQGLGVAKEYANIFSTLISMIFNYLLSNYWTFKAGKTAHKTKVSKYLVLGTVNYVFDVVLAFPFLAVTLGINPYIAKVITTACIVCWNFFLYRFWVFKTE